MSILATEAPGSWKTREHFCIGTIPMHKCSCANGRCEFSLFSIRALSWIICGVCLPVILLLVFKNSTLIFFFDTNGVDPKLRLQEKGSWLVWDQIEPPRDSFSWLSSTDRRWAGCSWVTITWGGAYWRRMARKTDTGDKEKDRFLMTLLNNLNSRCEPRHLVSFFFFLFLAELFECSCNL